MTDLNILLRPQRMFTIYVSKGSKQLKISHVGCLKKNNVVPVFATPQQSVVFIFTEVVDCYLVSLILRFIVFV